MKELSATAIVFGIMVLILAGVYGILKIDEQVGTTASISDLEKEIDKFRFEMQNSEARTLRRVRRQLRQMGFRMVVADSTNRAVILLEK